MAQKPVAAAPEKKRSIIKPAYNYRTRSLARTLVDTLSDTGAKKKLRAAMRDFTSFKEIREFAFSESIVDQNSWDSLLETWFDAGTKGE